MMSSEELIRDLYRSTRLSEAVLREPDVAHLVVHANKAVSSHLVPGLEVDVEELDDGIEAHMVVKKGAIIENPVHLCFGMLPEDGLQKIIMRVEIGEASRMSVLAHCTFPNAVDVRHVMDAAIKVGGGAEYRYFERHIHGDKGGVKVIPKARVELEPGARFKTEFELLRGRVGLIEIDYETTCLADSVMDMNARINAIENDVVKIREVGILTGERSVGVLTSRVAARDDSRAEVYNRITASAAYARGHVDCKEIVQGNAVVSATPIVEVNHPRAHVTHEAAIGSVDTKQLETLMSRGLNEDQATDLIIQGLLS